MGINDFPTGIPKRKVEMSSKTIERIPPQLGGTLMIMQRHGDYDRETGHLTNQGKENALERSRKTIEDILNQIPSEERQGVNVLIVASPTVKNEGQRSMETATAVIKSVKDVFQENGISKENILNDTPRPVEDIEAPRILNDNTGFLKFLEDRYGKGTKEFWIAFEEDVHKKEREEMEAEGPVEMSNRFAHFTSVLGRYARLFHLKNKEKPKRLIIWNVSHYDTITTFFKNHVSGIPQEEHIPVDYDGGMSLLISPDNKASVTLGDVIYPIEIGL